MPDVSRLGLYLPVYGGWLRRAADHEEPPTYDYVRRVALRAEEIGFHSLWIPDHLLNPIKGEAAPSLEAWTVAAAIAASTNKIVIIHTCLCEAFRYPAVLAKQAATLADISGGRFWLSIGAGWYGREYRAYGLPFYRHDRRVDRTREAIRLIRALWSENAVTLAGKYYQVDRGVLEPKPHPLPPIWYAGMSEASRELVADEADGWLMAESAIEEVRANVEDMKRRLRSRGRGPIEFAVPADTVIRETDGAAVEHLARMVHHDSARLDRLRETGLIGSAAAVAGKIEALHGAGVGYILLKLSPTLEELERTCAILA